MLNKRRDRRVSLSLDALEGRKLLSTVALSPAIQGAHIGTNVAMVQGGHIGTNAIQGNHIGTNAIQGSHIGTNIIVII